MCTLCYYSAITKVFSTSSTCCSLSTIIIAILVGLTHSTIQDGQTALKQASFSGHQKVVELLLGAEANPDLQDKVSTGQDSSVHTNLNSKYGDPLL